MRIARILTRMNLGGPARQVLASDPVLCDRGHQVRIFTGRPAAGEGDLFQRAIDKGLEVVRVPGLSPGWSPFGHLRALWFLRRELRAFAPQVVHTHTSRAGLVGRRAALSLARVARVHTFHGHVLEDYFPGAISRGLVVLERRLARRCDRIVAVSHATADDLLRLGVVPEGKLVVIPPGIDLRPFLAGEGRHGALRRLIGAGEAALLVGVIGRLAAVKRPQLALEVFVRLARDERRLELVFVGDGEQRRMLERDITGLESGLRERVHVVGALEHMPAVLADLDVVLMTSRNEGLPVAAIEAAAAGLPVVATPVGGVSELVVHGRTGWLGESVEALAEGLGGLLANPALRRTQGQRARLRAEGTHGAKRLAERLEKLYRTMIEERACAS